MAYMLRSQYDFYPSPRKKGDKYFTGTISVVNTDIRVELRFSSHRFLVPPKAYLIDWQHDSELRRMLGPAHISDTGSICYYDESVGFWDASLALRHTAGAINEIKDILEAKAKGNQTQEWTRDFNGYWPKNTPLYLCEKPSNRDVMDELSLHNNTWLATPDNWPERLEKAELKPTQWHVLYLRNTPIPEVENWPPRSLPALIQWMTSFTQNPAMLLARALCAKHPKSTAGYKPSKERGIVFYWDEQQPQFFGIRFSMIPSQLVAANQGRNKGLASLLNYRPLPIQCDHANFERTDPAYIHQRSLPSGMKTLKNKRILMIGAGAIGGYLAQQLAALGAGWGARGLLTLVDYDLLSSANLGRHILGINMIGKKKVDALKQYLADTFPHLEVQAVGNSIFAEEKLLSYSPDLVVNATGSESVSVALEMLVRYKFRDRPPIIHGWVLGHGLAAEAYFRKTEKDACFRCLWDGVGQDRTRRRELSKEPEEDKAIFAPCHHSFYPFTVNAAAAAATLMTTMIVDWLQEIDNETLRHIILRKDKCFNRPNSKPQRNKSCSVCAEGVVCD